MREIKGGDKKKGAGHILGIKGSWEIRRRGEYPGEEKEHQTLGNCQEFGWKAGEN